MKKSSLLKKVLVTQHDHKDCGAACLLTAIRWYGYDCSLETLRELSGTTHDGASILGLEQAASHIGFSTDAYRGTLSDLKRISHLVILHISKHKTYNHFVLCIGQENNSWLIADPEDGVVKLTDEELEKVWKSGAFLTLENTGELSLKAHRKESFLTWLKPHMLRYKNKLIIILVLSFFNTILLFSTSVFTEKLVDELLPSNDRELISKGIITWVLLLLISIGFSYVRNLGIAQLSRDFNTDLISSFFDKLLHLPKRFFDSKKTGDLITRLDDVENIEQTATNWIENGLIGTFAIFLSVIILFFYDVQIALINLAFLPILFFTVLMTRKKLLAAQRSTLVAGSLNTANYVDTMTGIEVIKRQRLETKFKQYALKFYRSFRKFAFNADKIGIRLEVLVSLALFASTIVVVSISSFKVLNNTLEIGNLLAIVSITAISSGYTANLAMAYIELEQSKIAFSRMYELINQEKESDNTVQPDFNGNMDHLMIKNLTFAFPGQLEIIKNVTMNLKQGVLYSIIGESGSGKSTLINLICRLYQPMSGTIYLNGTDYQQSPLAWREFIAVVPQDIKVFNATLWENINLMALGNSGEEPRSEVRAIVEKYGFGFFPDTLPFGLDTILGEGGLNLSGGQKQLMGLLRALLRNPKILLLDEATSSLDSENQQFVESLINRLKTEMIILQVTHDTSTTLNSDYIYILQAGKIVSHGKPDELRVSR